MDHISKDIIITTMIIIVCIAHYHQTFIKTIRNQYDQSILGYRLLQKVGSRYFAIRHQYNIKLGQTSTILKSQLNKIVNEVEIRNTHQIKNIKNQIIAEQCNAILRIQQYKELKAKECITKIINIYFAKIIEQVFAS